MRKVVKETVFHGGDGLFGCAALFVAGKQEILPLSISVGVDGFEPLEVESDLRANGMMLARRVGAKFESPKNGIGLQAFRVSLRSEADAECRGHFGLGRLIFVQQPLHVKVR